ncbi:MAG: hypothetical protein CR988_06410 [Treponema sp.]|nr:MAG: hypothetical protein CR988_06410 [Treponema sp.]
MKKQNTKALLSWGASFIKPFIPVLILLSIFSLLGSYLLTFEPRFTGKIIDALTQKDRQNFWFFLKIVIVFQLAGFVFSLLATWFGFLFQRKITIYTESRLYLNFLYLPTKKSAEKDSGKLLNLFLSDLSATIGIYTQQLPSILNSLIIMFVIGTRLIKIDVILFFITLLVSIIPIFLAKYFGAKQATIHKLQREQQDKYTSYLNETIYGLQDIKNYSSQKFFREKFLQIVNLIFKLAKKSTIIEMQSFTASFSSNFIINISLFIIIGLTVLTGKNTVGTITAALMYSQKFRSLVSSAAEVYRSILISFVSLNRIKENFEERQKKYSIIKEEKDNINNTKKLIIKNLNFSYNDNKKVLKNINNEFSFPSLYLVKGKNGAGKTTLCNIISGNLTEDKANLNGEIIFKNLSSKLSFVRQQSFIFNGTIKDNLCFGQKISKKKIKDILEKTKLNLIIENLPDGINTKLGGKDHILSQGQMQRLALSRCLLQNTEVILFDEVENALDTETSKALLQILKELKSEKLILMITHKNDYDNIADGIFNIS